MAYLCVNKSTWNIPMYDTWGKQIGTMYPNESFTYYGVLNDVYHQIWGQNASGSFGLCLIKRAIPGTAITKWHTQCSQEHLFSTYPPPSDASGEFYPYVTVKSATGLYNGSAQLYTTLPVGTRVYMYAVDGYNEPSLSGASNKHFLRVHAFKRPTDTYPISKSGHFVDTKININSVYPAVRGNW